MGVKPGQMSVVASHNSELRRRAQVDCRYHCRVWHDRGGDLPWGNIELLARWCADRIGPRWVDWYYRGGGVWYFREESDMVLFKLTWGW